MNGAFGATMEVTVPASSALTYVWVEGQPDSVRNLIADELHYDPARTFMLGPGGKMTAGFTQPISTLNYNVSAAPTAKSAALTTFVNTVDAVTLDSLDSQTKYTLAAYLIAKCSGGWTSPT